MSSSTVETRLDELGQRYDLDAEAVGRLKFVLRQLEEHPRAPTAVTVAEQAVDVHLADSLIALEGELLADTQRVADIGAGAGFPGLALAIARPEIHFSLVESIGWKCDFMSELARELDLRNVEVVRERAESWQGGMVRNDLVTARALATLNILLEYSAPLLKVGGRFVAWKGHRDSGEELTASRAANLLGMELVLVEPVKPYGGVESRHLYIYKKQEETPNCYPRRAGMARKRPLGSK